MQPTHKHKDKAITFGSAVQPTHKLISTTTGIAGFALKTLGKALKTLGKGFAECRTRQRGIGTQCIGKAFFAEYFFSGTRQRKSSRYGAG
jgi:hypothetical protein